MLRTACGYGTNAINVMYDFCRWRGLYLWMPTELFAIRHLPGGFGEDISPKESELQGGSHRLLEHGPAPF